MIVTANTKVEVLGKYGMYGSGQKVTSVISPPNKGNFINGEFLLGLFLVMVKFGQLNCIQV